MIWGAGFHFDGRELPPAFEQYIELVAAVVTKEVQVGKLSAVGTAFQALQYYKVFKHRANQRIARYLPRFFDAQDKGEQAGFGKIVFW
jgi:hypothetical protein